MTDRTAKALCLAAQAMVEQTGGCPLSEHDWLRCPAELKGHDACVNQFADCWEAYYLDQAEEAQS